MIEKLMEKRDQMVTDPALFKWSGTNDAQIVQGAVTLLNLGVKRVELLSDDADIKQMVNLITGSNIIPEGAELALAGE